MKFARLVTNEVQIYETANPSSPLSRLKLDNMASFSLSPGKRNTIAVFVSEKNSCPASVKVYDLLGNLTVPLCQKSFFRADTVQYLWNSIGTSTINI